MNEDEYVYFLACSLSADEADLPAAIKQAEAAIESFPNSAKLHCVLGDLILRQLYVSDEELNRARTCYEKALELDHQFA